MQVVAWTLVVASMIALSQLTESLQIMHYLVASSQNWEDTQSLFVAQMAVYAQVPLVQVPTCSVVPAANVPVVQVLATAGDVVAAAHWAEQTPALTPLVTVVTHKLERAQSELVMQVDV